MVKSPLHVWPSFGHMPVFSKHSCYQKNPFSMVSVCRGEARTELGKDLLEFFNYRRFRGCRGWMSIFPVNCGLSVLETAIDVETVYTYELCIYRPVGYVYTDLGVQNRKENVQIWCWKFHLRYTMLHFQYAWAAAQTHILFLLFSMNFWASGYQRQAEGCLHIRPVFKNKPIWKFVCLAVPLPSF